MCQTFLKQNHPANPAVAILERMDCLKMVVEIG